MRVRLLFAALLLPLAACAPPCGQVCRKVLFDCELDTERVALDECEAACERQIALYEQWEDDELRDLFDDHRRCVARSSCEELAEGVCYDGYEALFVFDTDKEPLPPATLVVSGAAFDEAEGATVVGRLADPDGATLATAEDTVEAGLFRLVFAGALEAARTYTVEWFVDADGDGACDPSEETAAFRTTLVQDASDRDRTLHVDPTTAADPAACASFPPAAG